MKKEYLKVNNLSVSKNLHEFINEELLKDTNLTPEKFWLGFDKVVHELSPKNKELLNTRKNLQKKIDEWHIGNKGKEFDKKEYKKFLKKIGYLKDIGPDFNIKTKVLDIDLNNTSDHFPIYGKIMLNN